MCAIFSLLCANPWSKGNLMLNQVDYSSLSQITLILCGFMPTLAVLHVFLLLILHLTCIFAADFAQAKRKLLLISTLFAYLCIINRNIGGFVIPHQRNSPS